MSNYLKHRYLLMTLDPVHIGTGGYRLGRVDLSIAREPGTNLPKLPGTSLSGAARSYAAMRNQSPTCAGQGQPRKDRSKGHCGQSTCPICFTFGSLQTKVVREGEETQVSHAGVVNLFDAHVVFFPVHSMVGPVWVTAPDRLALAGLIATGDSIKPLELAKQEVAVGDGVEVAGNSLNLGWLLMDVVGKVRINGLPDVWSTSSEWEAIQNQVVLVNDKLFGQVVNSNLEVRTSVSIDPTTGAAESGALFTYEAIPRATFLTSEVVQDLYRNGWESCDTSKLGADVKAPIDVVRAGLELAQWLGVGGMGTRGFGRLKIVGWPFNVPIPWEVAK